MDEAEVGDDKDVGYFHASDENIESSTLVIYEETFRVDYVKIRINRNNVISTRLLLRTYMVS